MNKNVIYIAGALITVTLLVIISYFINQKEVHKPVTPEKIEPSSVSVPLQEEEQTFIAETGSDPEVTLNVIVVTDNAFDRSTSEYSLAQEGVAGIYVFNQDSEVRKIEVLASPEGMVMPRSFELQPQQKLQIETTSVGLYHFKVGDSEFRLQVVE